MFKEISTGSMFNVFEGGEKAAVREGRWKEFNKHAILIAVGNYLRNQKHGVWREYYDTGELLIEENYAEGVLHGRFATYHTNGKLMSEGTYQFGSREGYFHVYDEQGAHCRSLLFSANELIEEIEASV